MMCCVVIAQDLQKLCHSFGRRGAASCDVSYGKSFATTMTYGRNQYFILGTYL